MMRTKLNIIISMLCFLMTSCFIDNDRGYEESSNGQVDVTFTVTLPQAETVDTHTRTYYPDTDIRNVDVLVFDEEGKFMNRIKVDEGALVPTGSGVNFSVRLDATPDRRILHLVANGRTEDGTDRINYGDIATGAFESEVIPRLYIEEPFTSTLLADITPLVMWGRTELNGVTVVNKVEGVKLLRTVASIQVKTEYMTPGNGLEDFMLHRFYLIDAPTQGFVAPDDYLSGASTPSHPRPFPMWERYPTELAGTDAYSPLYMYEQNRFGQYQGVVIEALYKGQPGFYKVAIADSEQRPLDIVRNHRYILKITKVTGAGYADMNTAVVSAPSNALKVDLIDDDEDFPCIVADGQYTMALSNNSLVMYGNPGGEVELGTVYSSRGIRPTLAVPVGCNWLTSLNATSLGNDKYRITGNFTNGTGQLCSTTLTMVCDNLSQTMQVDWNPAVSDVRDSDSYVVTLFGSGDKSWTAKVITDESDTKGVFLSSITSDPKVFGPAGGDGLEYMVFSLNSIYASNAYLHVAADGKGRGTVKVSTSVNGVAIARRVAIWIPREYPFLAACDR